MYAVVQTTIEGGVVCHARFADDFESAIEGAIQLGLANGVIKDDKESIDVSRRELQNSIALGHHLGTESSDGDHRICVIRALRV